MPAAIALLAVLVAGGVGLGAEQAAPGDALYPVKVSVNEKVAGAFQLDATNRAEWKIYLAERRLAEAEELASNGELSAEAVVELETRFDEHVEAYEEAVAELEAEENYEAIADLSARFESSLRAHRAILVEIATEAEADTRAEIENIITDIDAQIDNVTAVRAEAEAELDAELAGATEAEASASVEARLNAAETKVNNLISFFDKRSDRLSATAQSRLETRLEAVQADLAEARSTFEAEAYAETQDLIRSINDAVVETRTTITASGLLNLGGRTEAEMGMTDNESTTTDSADNNSEDQTTEDDENNGNNVGAEGNVEANTNGNANGEARGSGRVNVDIGL
jgi:hypothetical protein